MSREVTKRVAREALDRIVAEQIGKTGKEKHIAGVGEDVMLVADAGVPVGDVAVPAVDVDPHVKVATAEVSREIVGDHLTLGADHHPRIADGDRHQEMIDAEQTVVAVALLSQGVRKADRAQTAGEVDRTSIATPHVSFLRQSENIWGMQSLSN